MHGSWLWQGILKVKPPLALKATGWIFWGYRVWGGCAVVSDHFPELKQVGLVPRFGAQISAKRLLLWFKARWNRVTFDLKRKPH